MKLTTLSVAVAAMTVFAQSAQAREHYRHHFREARSQYLASTRYRASPQESYGDWSRDWSGSANRDDWNSDWSQAWSGEKPQARYARSAQPDRRPYGGRQASWAYAEPRPVYRRRLGVRPSSWARAEPSTDRGGLGGRPAAWCGWEMRQLVSADPGESYNLARNWAHWGHAGPAGVGAVVVWAHHVGKIVGQENGEWVVESGNDGNRVRTRPLPITRAIAIRWG